MVIKNEKSVSEASQKILQGVKKAFDKLVAEKAAKDQSLIIGDQDGNFKEVPAKELLLSAQKSNK